MEPKNKSNSVIILVIGMVLFLVVAVGVMGFAWGRSSSGNGVSLAEIEDVDAAVAESDEGLGLSDAEWRATITNTQNKITVTRPKYMARGDHSWIVATYRDPEIFIDKFKISFCGRNYEKNNWIFSINMRVNRLNCNLDIVAYSGDSIVAEFSENIEISTRKTAKMDRPSVPSDVSIGQAFEVEVDLSDEIKKQNIDVDGINWEAVASAGCEIDTAESSTRPEDSEDFTYKVYVANPSTTRCSFRFTTSVFSGNKATVFRGRQVVKLNPYVSPTPSTTPVPNTDEEAPAVKLNPSQKTVLSSERMEIEILANPAINNINALQVRLELNGGSIVPDSFRQTGGQVIMLGACDTEGSFSTTKNVCFDVTSLGSSFVTNQSLGKFTLEMPNVGSVKVLTDKDNGYIIGEKLVLTNSSTLGNYQVGN